MTNYGLNARENRDSQVATKQGMPLFLNEFTARHFRARQRVVSQSYRDFCFWPVADSCWTWVERPHISVNSKAPFQSFSNYFLIFSRFRIIWKSHFYSIKIYIFQVRSRVIYLFSRFVKSQKSLLAAAVPEVWTILEKNIKIGSLGRVLNQKSHSQNGHCPSNN